MKRCPLFVLLPALLVGCSNIPSSATPLELLSHDVRPPKQFQGGDPFPGYDGESKRYTYAYENAWWACVEIFSKDINHVSDIGDKAGNGWPSEVGGYWDGYSDAEIRVHEIIRKFGKEKAQAIFKKALTEPEM